MPPLKVAKILKLHDGQGLYLWVYEDGRKYWRLCYKIHDTEKSLSLGVYPVVGLKQARQFAQIERVKLSGNIDPSIDRQINKQKAKEAAANSFKLSLVNGPPSMRMLGQKMY